ncbi:histidine phosphatase family protein [Bacillus sp. 1P06AnD]|uniref:histidine phosphatase family protein n=1 Tax=Bacillus sp. 1P06AnD TaxID=3132208 RepID=UPI0039A1EC2A
MLTHVYLIRHAHSAYTADDESRPLSEQGFKDAKHIAQLLKHEKIELVLSSPYKRAIQTVQGIAEDIGKEIITVDGFKERKLSASSVQDFPAAVKYVWKHHTVSLEGGESNVDAQKRGVSALLAAVETYEGNHLAIGTHGNIMALMMNFFDEQYDYSFWKKLDMPDIYKLSFEQKDLKEVKRIWNRDYAGNLAGSNTMI